MGGSEPAHGGPGLGDLFLARLLSRRVPRRALQIVLFLTAAGSLYYRVGLGNGLQVLPWWGGLPALYFLWLVFQSTDTRCRVAYAAFSLLMAAAFNRGLLPEHARLVGAVEVAGCLVLMSALFRLGRDRGFIAMAVLRSARRKDDPDRAGGVR